MNAKKRRYQKRDGRRLRGRTWYVVLRRRDPDGKARTVWVSTGSSIKDDAIAKRDELRVSTRKGATVNTARFTFKDLLKLLPIEPSKALREAWPETMLARDIRTEQVRAFEQGRLAKGRARATVNNDLAALRHAFNLAVEDGILATKPVMRTPDPHNTRQGFFERELLTRVLGHLPECLRPIVEFCALTGWRNKSEALPLRWKENVDWRAQLVRLEPGTTKNHEGREFPFGTYPQLRRLLEQQLASGERFSSPFVFHNEGHPINYRVLRLAFRRACRKAKCSGMILHDLRRTAVRNLVRAGVPQVVAMSLTGHKTTAVFHRYAIIDTNLQREGVAKLAKAMEPATVE